ncbi:FAD linked oxidase domain containing protein [Grosmannia clavigera kw1407]|uniref:FAD linked oxidase domain containing protein n=1 Tax=Grosmannia clavigera (strain kw1407 / UAMH 11150) TaxID=655863 RepID=F0XEU8_GROCL|nr:FAD linked oxidase domain containing protein [Grosmannia clavigera kw1407]EFX03912.1 FAD linked oxidase domain containing protein [Grosmannia clavigera kw1407]
MTMLQQWPLSVSESAFIAVIIVSSLSVHLFHRTCASNTQQLGLYYVIENTLLSPLRFPGPLSAKLSSFWIVLQCRRARRTEAVLDLHRKHGDFVRIAPNHVSIADPRALRDIYGHNTGFTKGPFYEAFHQVDPVLFNMRGLEAHQKRRKLINPAFSPANLRAFEPESTLAYTVSLVDLLYLFDCATLIGQANFLAFDVIGDYAFGRTFGFLDRGYDHLNLIESIDLRGEVVNALGHLPPWCQPLMKYNVFDGFWYRGTKALAHLASIGREAYFMRKAAVYEQRKDLLSFLLNSKTVQMTGVLSERTIIAESISFIVGGSDTTSSSMTHFVDFVSRDPRLQHRLQEELDAAFPAAEADANEDWVADFGVAEKLPVLMATIRETMRLRPTSATGLERITPAGGRTIANVVIPAGTLVSVPTRSIMQDARIFKDPAEFNVDRWLQADSAQLLEYFNPFSLGPRSCIGRNFAWMEVIKTLATLFRVFEFIRTRSGLTELREGFFVKAKECTVRISRRAATTAE